MKTTLKNIHMDKIDCGLKGTLAYTKVGIVDYMIYFNRSDYYEEAKDILFENGEIIYQNEMGGIIKYNK